MKTRLVVSILVFLSFIGCETSPPPNISFYYWKTTFKLSQVERNALKSNHVNTLYIRYFDVSLHPNSNLPFPRSPIVYKEKPNGVNVIPVVYIQNQVMLDKATNPKTLAKKVYNYILQINHSAKIDSKEIQIDCDWTLKSRGKFLSFIDHFKKESGKIISCTIRLHQIKYADKTGIPNVDYGVMMYYNMGKLAANKKNSIYDREIANKYLSKLNQYPIDLKVAFPIFSWGVHTRKASIIALIDKLNPESFENDSNFEKNGNLILVKKDVLKLGYYFKTGDLIKFESVSAEQLMEMKEDFSKHLKKPPSELIYFHLDSNNLRSYDISIFQKMAHRF